MKILSCEVCNKQFKRGKTDCDRGEKRGQKLFYCSNNCYRKHINVESKIDVVYLVNRFNAGFSWTELKKEFHISEWSLRKILIKNRGSLKRSKRQWNYKGGYIDYRGYRFIHIDGKQIAEHRYLMEQKLGRKLKRREQVHHLNGIKNDNRKENLSVMELGEHQKKEHSRLRIKQLEKRIRELERSQR